MISVFKNNVKIADRIPEQLQSIGRMIEYITLSYRSVEVFPGSKFPSLVIKMNGYYLGPSLQRFDKSKGVGGCFA